VRSLLKGGWGITGVGLRGGGVFLKVRVIRGVLGGGVGRSCRVPGVGLVPLDGGRGTGRNGTRTSLIMGVGDETGGVARRGGGRPSLSGLVGGNVKNQHTKRETSCPLRVYNQPKKSSSWRELRRQLVEESEVRPTVRSEPSPMHYPVTLQE